MASSEARAASFGAIRWPASGTRTCGRPTEARRFDEVYEACWPRAELPKSSEWPSTASTTAGSPPGRHCFRRSADGVAGFSCAVWSWELLAMPREVGAAVELASPKPQVR